MGLAQQCGACSGEECSWQMHLQSSVKAKLISDSGSKECLQFHTHTHTHTEIYTHLRFQSRRQQMCAAMPGKDALVLLNCEAVLKRHDDNISLYMCVYVCVYVCVCAC